MKADLHVHSIYSQDAISRPETILQTAADRGIDIIAITDHDTTAGWQEFHRLSSMYAVQVVYGQEIKLWNEKYSDGEILALFLQQPIRSTSVSEILAEISAQDGIASIAHPFCDHRGEFRAYDRIDDWSRIAMETRNGRIYKKRGNEMAEGLAERLNLPATAGSDAHTPFEIGTIFMEFDGRNVNDLKRAILNRDVRISGEPSSALFSMISAFGRLGIAV